MDFFAGSIVNEEPTLLVFLSHTFCAFLFGVVVSLIYMHKNKHSKTMALTLIVLPALVQAIILLVSGSIGAGVAVAGAFSLVRFRSATGNAKDIGYLFFAMVLGFITGMGFLLYAFLFLVIVGCMFMITARFFQEDSDAFILRIVIPENLNYYNLFDETFGIYTRSAVFDSVKSTNMGSLYELKYTVLLKNQADNKAFIDEIRTRNGNLNIFLSREKFNSYEL